MFDKMDPREKRASFYLDLAGQFSVGSDSSSSISLIVVDEHSSRSKDEAGAAVCVCV